MSRSISVEDDHAVIRIPLDEVHPLCVALEECTCRAPKSRETQLIRERLKQGLLKLGARG